MANSTTENVQEPLHHASRTPAGRGDREALLNLYDALDDAQRSHLLRLAVGMVRQGTKISAGTNKETP